MSTKKDVRIAFEQKGIVLRLDQILPRKQLKENVKATARYRRILSSIKLIGIVEPLLVFPQNKRKGEYFLLDGHVRLEALKDLGEKETFCLIATDDEAFTYNHHVCVMTAIQEHFMISRAVASGVPKDKIAELLCVDVGTIRDKETLITGVCEEVVDLLKDRPIAQGALREIRRVVPMRQIEIAELMIASNNFSLPYAKCLLATTSEKQFVKAEKKDPRARFAIEDLAKIEREMESIGQDMRTLEETHGRNALNLVIVVGYLRKLLGSANVVKYLARKQPELLSQFQKLAEATSLDGGQTESVA